MNTLPIRRKFVKLVRDKVPQFYPRLEVIWQISEPKDRTALLEGKLIEEVIEYLREPSMEELADVQEVLLALARRHPGGVAELESLRTSKGSYRGGYEQGIMMMVEGPDHIDP